MSLSPFFSKVQKLPSEMCFCKSEEERGTVAAAGVANQPVFLSLD